MEIKKLEPNLYAEKKFTVRYETNGYYDIQENTQGFQIKYVSYPAPKEKTFDDVFFAKWLDHPIAYGAFIDHQMIGYVEGAMETWNQRFRISNICIFETSKRHTGIGKKLMETIIEVAQSLQARMVVLETQSCNVNAIEFYKKMGFCIIGFDLYAYSNMDREQHEIRIEMGKKL